MQTYLLFYILLKHEERIQFLSGSFLQVNKFFMLNVYADSPADEINADDVSCSE